MIPMILSVGECTTGWPRDRGVRCSGGVVDALGLAGVDALSVLGLAGVLLAATAMPSSCLWASFSSLTLHNCKAFFGFLFGIHIPLFMRQANLLHWSQIWTRQLDGVKAVPFGRLLLRKAPP